MTKTISLSDEAYGAVKDLKLKNESFSEVIMKLVATGGDLCDILDLHPELAGDDELETATGKLRKDLNKRLG